MSEATSSPPRVAFAPASVSLGRVEHAGRRLLQLSFKTEGQRVRDVVSCSSLSVLGESLMPRFAIAIELTSLGNLLHPASTSRRNFSSAWYPKQGAVFFGISLVER